jgi:hypothetical protein
MKADDNDKLWELLGKTRPPAVSPFFSRNVLRAIRQEAPPLSLPRALLFRLNRTVHRWAWQLALAGTCAVAAVVAFPSIFPSLGTQFPSTFVRHHHTADVQSGLARQIVSNPDYEVIKHLDELVADEESSLWLDDSVH